MLTLLGGGQGQNGDGVNLAFEFTVKTDNAGTSAANQFTIPITSATPYNIKTSDGHSITGATGATTLTFSAPGTYTVKITDSCDGWQFKYAGDRLKMLNISNWGVFRMDQTEAFHGAENMTCSAIDAPIYPATQFYYAFRQCRKFNGAIGNWDVSQVTSMQGAFYACFLFNQDLDAWDVSNVFSMREMFYFAYAFNGNISTWDVSGLVAGGTYRLLGRTNFNGDLSAWNVSTWTSMQYMFEYSPFNNNSISNWDVSNVTNFIGVFNQNTAFNQDISSWNTSSATSMTAMFSGASSFNQPIGSWDVSNVTSMSSMFYNADAFNQDLSAWDVSNVISMGSMFQDRGNSPDSNLNISGWTTTSLNQTVAMFKGTGGNTQDLSGWDMSNAEFIQEMFAYGRINFNPSSWNISPSRMWNTFLFSASTAGNIDTWNFSGWDITGLTQSQNFLQGLTLSTANYDATLVAWENQLQTAYPGGVGYTPINSISFGGSKYSLGSAAEAARTSLISTYGWTITDGGGIAVPFTITVDTTLGDGLAQFTIPTTGTGYNYNVATSDGQSITGNTGNTTITFPASGTYDIEITGDFPRIYFNNGGDRLKLTDVKKWGSIAWNHMEDAFHGCNNLTVSATDAPNLSGVTNMDSMFARCHVFNSNINHWDVSTITDMGSLFFDCFAFNQPLNNWDVSNNTDFSAMFRGVGGVTTFNQDISGWDTSSATNMIYMFSNSQFNQPIGSWDVSSVTAFAYMFSKNFAFDQPLNSWNMSGKTNLSAMFFEARAFNQDLDLWDVSACTNMYYMFQNATLFNGNITTWNTSNVTNMAGMFNMWWGGARPFNQNLNSWDVSSVTDMNSMFSYCINYNQPMNTWNTSNVTNMQGMFLSNTNFNQDIGMWDVSNVTNMRDMFQFATNFNQNIGGWNVSSVSNFYRFMYNSGMPKGLFNQDISGWNTSSAVNFFQAFWNTSMVSNLSNWDIDLVTNFSGFKTAGDPFSTADYDSMLVSWENQLQIAYPGGVGYTPTIDINFSSSQYTLGSAAEAARTSLINTYGWTITDGGGIVAPLILRVDTSLGDGLPNMRLPMVSGTYDVDWGDGNVATGQTGGQTHTYATGGVYDIKVTGGTNLQYNFGADVLKVTNLLQWGSSAWTGAYGMFGGCQNMVITATDIPDFSVCWNFGRMFRRTTFTNIPNIDQWDMSSALRIDEMFWETACDPDVSSWQITQVTNFSNFAAAPSAFTTSNYDNILVSWEAQLQTAFPGGVGYTPTISIVFAGTQYTLGSAADTARASLVSNFGWTITDGGGIAPPTTTTTTTAASSYTTNLVASYNFDSDFTDYTGNNPLTPSGGNPPDAGVAGGIVSNCAGFNSSGDYTLAADSNDFSFTDGVNDLPFSVSFWANFTGYDASSTGGAWLLSKRDASTNEEYQIMSYQNELAFVLFSGGGSANLLNARITYPPPIGSWHHYTFTYDGSATFAGLKVYIDGVSQSLTNGSVGTYTGMINGTHTVNIGSRSWQNTAGSFYGKMDEYHIWKNRELTAAEVLDIYNTENAGSSILPAPASPPLLDTYTGAAAAYSLRDLSSSTTNVVRVRRSSDNTEQDFTSTQVTDGTLTTFVGAGNDGFVTVWYDQSGNGRNAAQTTTTLQPVIVSSGSLVLLNGLPAIDTEKTLGTNSKYLQTDTGSPFYAVNDASVVVVGAQKPGETAWSRFIDLNYIDNFTMTRNSTSGLAAGFYTQSANVNTSIADNTQYQISLYRDASTGVNSLSINNFTPTTNTLPTTTAVANNLLIGQDNTYASTDTRKLIQEVVLWETNYLSTRSGIDININSYYTIY